MFWLCCVLLFLCFDFATWLISLALVHSCVLSMIRDGALAEGLSNPAEGLFKPCTEVHPLACFEASLSAIVPLSVLTFSFSLYLRYHHHPNSWHNHHRRHDHDYSHHHHHHLNHNHQDHQDHEEHNHHEDHHLLLTGDQSLPTHRNGHGCRLHLSSHNWTKFVKLSSIYISSETQPMYL